MAQFEETSFPAAALFLPKGKGAGQRSRMRHAVVLLLMGTLCVPHPQGASGSAGGAYPPHHPLARLAAHGADASRTGSGGRGGRGGRDEQGWIELNSVVGSHTRLRTAAGVEGLSMAAKIGIAGGAADEAAAIRRGVAKVEGSLLDSASRDEFFALLDERRVYVRAGTLYRAPAVNAAADLSALSESGLNSYALDCGLPGSFWTRRTPTYLSSSRSLAELTTYGGKGSARRRRMALEEEVEAILRGPIFVRLSCLTRAALRRLLRRFGKLGTAYTKTDLTKACMVCSWTCALPAMSRPRPHSFGRAPDTMSSRAID